MTYLDPNLGELLRPLGVEGELPQVLVYRLPCSSEGHLHPECLSSTSSRPSLASASILEADLVSTCPMCLRASSWPQVKLYLDELHDLQWIVQQVCEVEETLRENDPQRHGFFRSFLLGDLISRCRRYLGEDVTSLETSGTWTFSSVAAPLLRSRLEAVRDRAIELLRTPEGARATWESLLKEDAFLPQPDVSVFVEPSLLGGMHFAAVYAFGVELAPNRFWVRDSTLAVSLLARTRAASTLVVGDTSEDVLATAIALWEPGGETRLGSAEAALEAARILHSTPSNA